MAFSESEKYKIIRYLCWPAGVLDPNNTSYSKIISDRLTNVLSGAETEARLVLNKIIDLDSKQSASVSQAGVKKIDDIEFFGNAPDVLRREKRKAVEELSSLLGIANLCSGGGVIGNVCV